jgi:hypothetical protein
MKQLRILFWLHVILGPIGAWICAYDWSHEETWDVWFRNPMYAKPFLIIGEIFIWTGAIYLWWRDRNQDRMKEGMRLMQEAIRLLDEGRTAEADELYREGKRLTGC